MKYILFPLLLLSLCFNPVRAAWINASFTYDGHLRQYRTYVPAGYDPAQPATLIVVLHGLGGSMNDAAGIGITNIADTANIILLSPQALDYNSPVGVIEAAWNSGIEINIPGIGLIAVNGTIDDVGFIQAMMDSATAEYSVNPARVYACGASMGGFMTQRLACEAADRFAAVASVMGTYALALPPCSPGKVLPMAHFHGTNDEVVSWNGELLIGTTAFPVGMSVDALVTKWVALDACATTPEHETWPDSNNDNLYVDHYSYKDAAGVSRVELFKVNGGTHTWYQSQETGGELDYAVEIWKFFNKQYNSTSGIAGKVGPAAGVRLIPNPASSTVQVDSKVAFTDVRIFDIYGKTVLRLDRIPSKGIDISALAPGLYLLRLSAAQGVAGTVKLLKR